MTYHISKIYRHKGNQKLYALVSTTAMFKDKETVSEEGKQWRKGLYLYVPLYMNNDPGPFIRTAEDFEKSFEKVSLSFIGSPMKVHDIEYNANYDMYVFNYSVPVDAEDLDKTIKIEVE